MIARSAFMLSSSRWFCRPRLALFAILAAVASGCGGTGEEVSNLSGTVTYDGQPVPAGTILFRPDVQQGNKGRAGHAVIRDGKFDTRGEGGEGIVAGPHVAVISGYDGKYADEQEFGAALFPQQELKFSLSEGSTTIDFEIPRVDP